jgi:hypothetical protein
MPNAAVLLGLHRGILERLADRATEDRYPLTRQRIIHDVKRGRGRPGMPVGHSSLPRFHLPRVEAAR